MLLQYSAKRHSYTLVDSANGAAFSLLESGRRRKCSTRNDRLDRNDRQPKFLPLKQCSLSRKSSYENVEYKFNWKWTLFFRQKTDKMINKLVKKTKIKWSLRIDWEQRQRKLSHLALVFLKEKENLWSCCVTVTLCITHHREDLMKGKDQYD